MGALAGLGLACPSSNAPAPEAPEPRPGLRVGLPEGWKATPSPGGLDVGPNGRVVLQLESTARPVPTADALERALQPLGVVVRQKDETPSFVGIRYSLTADGGALEGFLGVRRLESRSVWCATVAGVSASEAADALAVCRAVSEHGE